MFRKFQKQHICRATRLNTTEFRDTALIKFVSEISKASFGAVTLKFVKDRLLNIGVLRILYFSNFFNYKEFPVKLKNVSSKVISAKVKFNRQKWHFSD